MEISDIQTTLVRGAEGPDARHLCFVRVHTDEDIVGIGEATAPGMERATEAAVHDLGRQIVGRDPRNVEGLWDRMYNAYAWNWGPVSMTALSGIEMALWDIVGKYHDVRVCDLFGGPMTETVKVYANGVIPSDSSPEECARAAESIVDRGYDVIKFIPSYDEGERAWLTDRQRELVVQRLEAVREAVGDDVEIAVETHGVLAPQAAIEVSALVEPFDPLFIEEPIPPENQDALRRIRGRIDAPIATGERLLTTFDYRDVFQHPTPLDIVQPDVNNCGGISQLKKIADMAYTEYVPIAPHNSRGPVATAAAAQVCATVPNFLILEYFPDGPPWRQSLIVGEERVEEGWYHLPDGPGLGVEVDFDAVEEYPYEKSDRGESVYTHGFRDLWR